MAPWEGEALHAETAAHVRRDDAHLVLGDGEAAREIAPHAEDALAAEMDGVAVVGRVVLADDAARLDRVDDDAVDGEVDLDDLRRPGERRIGGVAIAELPIE